MANDYEEVPYPGRPIPQAHPVRMATMAQLFGIAAPPVERARVLELGCGDGSHILPLAFLYPEARFTGVDLAGRHIRKGIELARELALDNIDLHAADILDFDFRGHVFDYVIAHGLYSWVPANVRERILQIASTVLAESGIAFISYNTLPGGYFRLLMRDMMMLHASGESPGERARAAVPIVRLVASAQSPSSTYRQVIEKELQRLETVSPDFLLHDDLAPCNEPVYFTEFIRRCEQHGLQFLSESEFAGFFDERFPPEVLAQVDQYAAGDLIRREQYLDFLKARRFRQTLLCRAGMTIDRARLLERLTGLWVASPMPVPENVDLSPGVKVKFSADEETSITVEHAVAKRMFLLIADAWPGNIAFEDLTTRAGARSQGERTALAGMLWRACGVGLVSLDSSPWTYATAVSERPLASLLARVQAQQPGVITTLRHGYLQIEDGVARTFLRLLDGTRDHAALRRDLAAAENVDISAHEVEENLREFLHYALLMK